MSAKLENVEGPFESRYEANRATLDILLEKGLKSGKAKEVLNFLYFKKEDDCRAASEELADIGFKIENISDCVYEDETQWLLTCWIKISLEEDSVNHLTNFLETLARKYSGEYDGWEVEFDADEHIEDDEK